MQHWDVTSIETPDGSRSPVVLHSQDGQARAVLIALAPGQTLGEHQVKEAALVYVMEGGVRVDAGDESIDLASGSLVRFDPDERRTVTSDGGARLLLLLAPWPGEEHYRGDRAGAGVSAS